MTRIDYTALCVSLFVIIGTVSPQATQAQSVVQRGGLGLTPVTLSSSDLGDIDDDGDQDLVVTGLKNGTFGNKTATLYENNGDGTFTPVSTGLSGVSGGSSDFADVDSDGDLDLLITGEEGFSPSATLYKNDGNGSFSATSAGLNGVQNGHAAFADLDDDPDLELVITGSDGSLEPTTTLYENDGSGNFSSVDAGLMDVEDASLDFADIEGDQDQDLIVAGSSANGEATILYTNDGSGNFSEASQGLVDVKGSADFGDVDNDGDPDLLLSGFSASGSRTTTLYLNDGQGNLSEAEVELAPVSQGSASIVNVDGDEDRDLVISGRNSSNDPTTTLYTNDGANNFTAAETNLTGTVGALNVGDVEGDGDRDLLLTGNDALFDASARLYVNNTVQNAPNRPPQANRPPSTDTLAAGRSLSSLIEVGDPDGDPVTLRLTQGSSTSGTSFTDLGGGIGRFEFSPSTSQAGSAPSFTVEAADGNGDLTTFSFSVRVPDVFAAVNAEFASVSRSASAFGDVDGDGDQDIVLTGLDSSRTEQAVLYESDGQGGFSPTNTGLMGVQRGATSFSDVDQDGDLDLFITGSDDLGDATATLYENDGAGNFSSTSTNVDPTRGGSVAFGDVTGDGTPDLAVTGPDQSLNPSAALYFNDGSGGFNKANADLTPVENGSTDFADVDQDGDLDLLLTGEGTGGGSAILYENDGNGSFSEMADLGSWIRSSADFGDIDEDGDPDLVIGGSESFSVALTLYENDGDGNFTALNENLKPVGRGDVKFGDINGDGDLDLVAVGRDSDRIPTARIYENNGTGEFSPLGAGLLRMGKASSISLGDATGNGTLDLLMAGNIQEQPRDPTTQFYDNLASSAITASTSVTVSSDGTTDFGNTGLDIAFSGTNGSGTVVVKKMDTPPNGRPGISETNVSAYRFVVDAESGLSFDDMTTLRFDVSTLDGISDASQVSVYRRSIQGHGVFSKLDTNYDSGANELTSSTGRFSEFVLASPSDPLPVEWTHFEATVHDGNAQLTWHTASERRNTGFVVQRRSGGSNQSWQRVGFVDSKAQQGTANESLQYRFTDATLPYEGDRFAYRLKQIDTDGSTSVSRTVTVRRTPAELQLLAPHPNPVRDRATVRFAVPNRQEVKLRLYDTLGRVVRTLAEGPMQGRQKQHVRVDDLSSGVYFLQLRTGAQTRTQRLTIVQ